MKTFKYIGSDPLEVPSLEIRIGVKFDEDNGKPIGTTFEIPDEFAATFEAQPDLFVPSKTKSPDVTVSPELVTTLTGPVTVAGATPAPESTPTTN